MNDDKLERQVTEQTRRWRRQRVMWTVVAVIVGAQAIAWVMYGTLVRR